MPPSCALGCTPGCARCLWDEPYVPKVHPRIRTGMHLVSCWAPWDVLCTSLCALGCAWCPCWVPWDVLWHPQDGCQDVHVPQDVCWEAPPDGSCPPACAPGCARSCAVTPRAHLGCAVCPRMCPQCCAHLAAPLCPPSWCHQGLLPLEGCGGSAASLGWGGCGPLDPPSAPWLAGAAGREGTVPTALLQKGKGSSCCQDTLGHQPAPGAGLGLCLAPCPGCQRRVGSPGACPDGPWALVATLGPFSRSHPKGPQRLSSCPGVQVPCASVPGTPQPGPASASPLRPPKARAARVLIIAESSQASAGAKSCAVPRALFLLSAASPKH